MSARVGPSAPGSVPVASAAATGAKTSRPWNVALRGERKKRSSVSSTMRRTVAGGAASESRPLSGPTRSAASVSTQSARRALPTPGSTTATWTVPRGKPRHRVAQHERAGEHVLRRDAVRHVDHRHARRARRDHALHDADQGIGEAEVGGEGDQRGLTRLSEIRRSTSSQSTWPIRMCVSWMRGDSVLAETRRLTSTMPASAPPSRR